MKFRERAMSSPWNRRLDPGRKLPVYRRWWFWIALALIILFILSLMSNLPDQADVLKPALPQVEG